MTSSLDQLGQLLKPRVLSLVYEHQFGFTINGNSYWLGGQYDRELLIALRQRSDLIVTTGKTAEIEQYVQPKKPLILITTRKDSAYWLKAERLELDNPKLLALLKDKNILFETGLQMSNKLFNRGLVDQIVLHHDKPEFSLSALAAIDVETVNHFAFHDRYISIFERRGS